ncbi:hypothetical protein L596_002015 [Steinernema carpocapsae]|uniref:Uncharacterized protein n=1 Tax=Steinernema carpocapsae TaxID=34508 RepID=A0A4U8URW2_STECR|nr:hypothetical protein L596_002015 [Steinernema carpocapsae]
MTPHPFVSLLIALATVKPAFAADYDTGDSTIGTQFTDLTNLGSLGSPRRQSGLLNVPRYDWKYDSPAAPSYIRETSDDVHFSVPASIFDSSNSNYFARMAQDVMNKVISTVAGSYSNDNLFPLYEPSPSPSTSEKVKPSTRQPQDRFRTADIVRNMKITPSAATREPESRPEELQDSYFVRELKENEFARKIFRNIDAFANPQVPIEEPVDGRAVMYTKSVKLQRPEIRFAPRKKYTFKTKKELVDTSEDFVQVFPTTTTANPVPNLFERKAVEYFVGQSIAPRLLIDSLPERVATTATPVLSSKTYQLGSDDNPVRILPRRRSQSSKNRRTWLRKIHRVLVSYKKHRKEKKTLKHRRTVHLPMRYE